MAKKTTTKKSAAKKPAAKGGGKPKPGTKVIARTADGNQLNATAVKDAVKQIDALDEAQLSERGKFMERCRRIKEQRDVVFDEAKSKGVPVKELRKAIKARQLEKQADALFNDLEPDEQENYEAIRVTLGDWDKELPLGKFANEQRDKKQNDKDDQVSLLAKLGRGPDAEDNSKLDS